MMLQPLAVTPGRMVRKGARLGHLAVFSSLGYYFSVAKTLEFLFFFKDIFTSFREGGGQRERESPKQTPR